jgi:hypothetical protein
LEIHQWFGPNFHVLLLHRNLRKFLRLETTPPLVFAKHSCGKFPRKSQEIPEIGNHTTLGFCQAFMWKNCQKKLRKFLDLKPMHLWVVPEKGRGKTSWKHTTTYPSTPWGLLAHHTLGLAYFHCVLA